jgi:hypothetical protein
MRPQRRPWLNEKQLSSRERVIEGAKRAKVRLKWLFDLIAAGLYERETPNLARLLGRRPTSLDDFAANLVRTSKS